MHDSSEVRIDGLGYLDAATSLLHRIRCSHPTAGLYEAADLQWWWAQRPRTTDELDQLFWFDREGRPEAAVIATDSGDRMQLDPILMPDATPEWVEHAVQRGLAHARRAGIDAVSLEVDRADHVLRTILAGRGFTVEGPGVVEAWMDADARPAISPIRECYRLTGRDAAILDRPHHMINPRRDTTDPEPRLRQTSLYRPDLDLAVYTDQGEVAAYGLFWFDPVTSVGLVEPMRTEDDHQRQGLARHVLTSGLELLAQAGATRIKICFEPDNPASSHLYPSVGFAPDRENDIVSGRTSAVPASPGSSPHPAPDVLSDDREAVAQRSRSTGDETFAP
ncbi:MAG: GNAT family N-acetyltransferase [Ilumatobacteraceae bacterium]